MYFYIYDEFLQEKKYKNALHRIENRLTDLEMKHRITRLSILKNVKEMIEDEIKKGVSTIVAVGDDSTVFKIINVLAHHPDVTLGIIPVGPNNNIAKILGIPAEEDACDILSSRIIKKLDLGKINHHHFISEVSIKGKGVAINTDNQFSIKPEPNAQVKIFNFNFRDPQAVTNPQDGVLEIFIEGKSPTFMKKMISAGESNDVSLFQFKDAEITTTTEPATITIDYNQTLKTPAHVSILPQKLKVIVGKNRMFD
ncbi:MAG: diacylglycerol/lipid kinase family protein [Patescibacteria group bacterium]